MRHRLLRECEGAGEDFLDLPREAVGLRHALDARVAVARAEQRGELAVAVEALVVDLADDDVREATEEFFEIVWERVEVLDVQSGHGLALQATELHGLLNRTLAGAPADEQHMAFGSAVDFWDG